MRDLAKQGMVSKRPKASSRTLRLFAVAFVAAFVIYLLLSKVNKVGSGGIILRDAPRGLVPVKVDGVPVDTKAGVNLVSQSAKFTNVSGEAATATAQRVYGSDYTMTVFATLPDPKGSKYQVWIVGEGQTVNAGFMDGSKNTWNLTFRDTNKYAALKGIWITREITTEDERPEKHILEGSF